MVVASIGPTTSETLRELDLPVDLEPEHAKMGHLVSPRPSGQRAFWRRKRVAACGAPPPGGRERAHAGGPLARGAMGRQGRS